MSEMKKKVVFFFLCDPTRAVVLWVKGSLVFLLSPLCLRGKKFLHLLLLLLPNLLFHLFFFFFQDIIPHHYFFFGEKGGKEEHLTNLYSCTVQSFSCCCLLLVNWPSETATATILLRIPPTPLQQKKERKLFFQKYGRKQYVGDTNQLEKGGKVFSNLLAKNFSPPLFI